ncbi:hypothetical protein M0805_002824 [Coniferiporia weirii]|nr:hypothetical protein M0805_002824 [Coniferiporia weirii]
MHLFPNFFPGRSKTPPDSTFKYAISRANSVAKPYAAARPIDRSTSSVSSRSSTTTYTEVSVGTIVKVRNSQDTDNEHKNEHKESTPPPSRRTSNSIPVRDTVKISNTDTVVQYTHGPVTKAESTSSTHGTLDCCLPIQSVVDVTMSIAKLTGDVAPVPWLGLAVEIVGNIVQLCKNVSNNRHSMATLAEHCCKLLDILKEANPGPDTTVLERLQSDLERLLTKVKDKMEEWGKLNWFISFVQQDTISKAISEFHSEIDQFCNYHTLAVHMKVINWQERHDEKSKKDFEDAKAFLSDTNNTRELERRCHTDEIAALRGDFAAFFDFAQKLLLESGRGLTQNDSSNRTQVKAFENNFSAIFRASRMLPPGMELTVGLTQMRAHPEYGAGSLFDIYHGTCFNDVNFQCAFKVVRHVNLGDKTRKRFGRQLKHWQSIHGLAAHAQEKGQKVYILPLIGAIHRENHSSPFLCFISPWMEKGNAVDHVKKYEDTDRISLIRKIALGLETLHKHDPPFAHGYIRGSNILIDDMCDPLLNDFGLMRANLGDETLGLMELSSIPTGQAIRWLAPELLDIANAGKLGHNGGKLVLTTESDIFMYGMTVLELMTGERPYSDLKTDT